MPSAKPSLRTTGVGLLLAGLFFGAGGVWLLSMALGLYAKQQDICAHAEHAMGTVVDLWQRDSRDHKTGQHTTLYAPVFTFTDYAGTARRVASRVNHANQPGYRVGETVLIVYHHDRPKEAELDTFYASWDSTLIAGWFGTLGFLVGGLFVGVGARRILKPDRSLAPPHDPAILSGP